MTGNNPTDRSKLGTKRHILTDKKGIPLSAVISSASTHDIKLVTNVVDSIVIKRPSSSSKPKTGRRKRIRLQQHLCLDKAYNSEPEEQELLKRGYVLHIPQKRRKGEKEDGSVEVKVTIQHILNRRKHSAKRWVVERTNSWHNRFRKLYTRYEKKAENYLGLVQFSCCMIIYRKMILG
jgi:transposase